MEWDDLFMSTVYLIASKSRDPRTHVGAVIVSQDNTIISLGYNGIPRGIEYTSQVNKLAFKSQWYEHAERNAIYNCLRTGGRVLGSKMYTNDFPCPDCARAIIQVGIKQIIIDKVWYEISTLKKAEIIKKTLILLTKAEVEIIFWNGELTHLEKFCDGKVI